jgi:hypothetical protein
MVVIWVAAGILVYTIRGEIRTLSLVGSGLMIGTFFGGGLYKFFWDSSNGWKAIISMITVQMTGGIVGAAYGLILHVTGEVGVVKVGVLTVAE